MRLVDLAPRWFAQPGRRGHGVTFECPHCPPAPGRTRLAVAFANPLDGGAPVPLDPGTLWPLLWPTSEDPEGLVTVPPGVHWTRDGETFETLTLTPSVDASRSGHWHGHVRDGQIC